MDFRIFWKPGVLREQVEHLTADAFEFTPEGNLVLQDQAQKERIFINKDFWVKFEAYTNLAGYEDNVTPTEKGTFKGIRPTE